MNCPYLFAHSFWFFSKFRISLCIRVISALCDKCCKYFLPLYYLLLTLLFLAIQNSFIKDINSSFYCSGIFSHRNISPTFRSQRNSGMFSSSYLEGFIFTIGSLIHSDFILLYSMRNGFNYLPYG